MHVKSAVKQVHMENECVSPNNKFNHRELKRPQVTTVHLLKCA